MSVIFSLKRTGALHTYALYGWYVLAAAFKGTFDEEILRRMLVELERHLGITTLRGMTVLEVDANLGTETVSLLKRHGVERVTGEVDLDAVDLVWMDAQGHEGHVLAGAQRLVAAGIPVLTEYWPYGLSRAGGLDRFHALVADGYGKVIDLRSNRDEPPVTLEAARIATLADRYSDEATSYSDLLLLPR